MTQTLTVEASPVPLEWSIETANAVLSFHISTANVAPIALGGMWKGHQISAADIQQARKELWSKLEAGE